MWMFLQEIFIITHIDWTQKNKRGEKHAALYKNGINEVSAFPLCPVNGRGCVDIMFILRCGLYRLSESQPCIKHGFLRPLFFNSPHFFQKNY